MRLFVVSVHITLATLAFWLMPAPDAVAQAAAELAVPLVTRTVDVDGVAIRVRTAGVTRASRVNRLWCSKGARRRRSKPGIPFSQRWLGLRPWLRTIAPARDSPPGMGCLQRRTA